MFGRRRGKAIPIDRPIERDADDHVAENTAPDNREVRCDARPRTLETMCACGHTRGTHTGLRMEVDGRCLECECARFASGGDSLEPREETLRRVLAAIAAVDRMQLIADGMKANATAAIDSRGSVGVGPRSRSRQARPLASP
jgi:hypothetical protein